MDVNRRNCLVTLCCGLQHKSGTENYPDGCTGNERRGLMWLDVDIGRLFEISPLCVGGGCETYNIGVFRRNKM